MFDCDGTLVDSGASILAVVSMTLAQHGRQIPPQQECRRVIGLSLSEALGQLAPTATRDELERLVADYKTNFAGLRDAGGIEEPLFDGVPELLDALEAAGWQLAVATGKSDRGLGHCLAGHGLHARFVSLQTADRHPSKPDPAMVVQAMADAGAAPETTFVVGDTSFDMHMARSAGTTAIGAAWGYHPADELLAAGAHGVADAPLDVLALLPRLMEPHRG